MPNERAPITSEDLAYWYLRLNGCLTVRNFVLHPNRRTASQRTDADIVAIRFPGQEFEGDADDLIFCNCRSPILLIAEVKGGNANCGINPPWLRDNGCISYVLRRFAPPMQEDLHRMADEWRKTGGFTSAELHGFFLCFGQCESDELRSLPRVQQKTWRDVLRFLHNRFSTHGAKKRDHQQWELAGNFLWDAFRKTHGNREKFNSLIADSAGLPRDAV